MHNEQRGKKGRGQQMKNERALVFQGKKRANSPKTRAAKLFGEERHLRTINVGLFTFWRIKTMSATQTYFSSE